MTAVRAGENKVCLAALLCVPSQLLHALPTSNRFLLKPLSHGLVSPESTASYLTEKMEGNIRLLIFLLIPLPKASEFKDILFLVLFIFHSPWTKLYNSRDSPLLSPPPLSSPSFPLPYFLPSPLLPPLLSPPLTFPSLSSLSSLSSSPLFSLLFPHFPSPPLPFLLSSPLLFLLSSPQFSSPVPYPHLPPLFSLSPPVSSIFPLLSSSPPCPVSDDLNTARGIGSRAGPSSSSMLPLFPPLPTSLSSYH